MDKPFSFPIYEIEPSTETQAHEATHLNHSHRDDFAQPASKVLHLQPEKLTFESDIGHTRDIGTRLVDQPEHKNNFELWEELLRFRQRHRGDQGTLDIWKGLTTRVDGVLLPLTGERAEFFWKSFVELGLKRELFLKDVVDYAISLANRYGNGLSSLYESVVGGLLERGRVKQAVEWHRKLQSTGLAVPDDLVRVLLPAIHSVSQPADTSPLISAAVHQRRPVPGLEIFQTLCRASPGHQVYGRTISILLKEGHGEEAIRLHKFLTRRNDHPKSLEEMQPLLDYVEKYGVREEFKQLRSYAQRQFKGDFESLDLETSEQGEDPTDAVEGAPGGNAFKDDIGARLFATRALNFDMVLGTLKMLGVSTIGPRILREMAIRSHGSQDILEKIKIFRQSGISVGDNVFARLIQKLAAQNREILLSDLLRSDQHPVALEDPRLQESLLVSYYMARDSRQYNLSLAVLAELFPDSPGLLDIHFRKHIATGEFRAATKVVDELALRGKTLNENSVDFMAEQVLTPRRMNHQPPPGNRLSTHDEVMFIYKILQRVVPAGVYVSAAFWVEMLKRLGMCNYWDDLRNCCLWLVHQYSPKSRSRSGKPWVTPQSRTGPVRGQDSRMVNLIFTPGMQGAIVAWGFRCRVTDETESKTPYTHSTTGDKLIPWTRGLILLRELEQAGLVLQRRAIRDATRVRLAMLYGEYCHSARRMNRMLRRRNPYSLQRVLVDISRAWGESSLFDGMESQPDRLVNPPRTLASRRRSAGVVLSRKRAR